MIGETIGSYRVVQQLGQGGMGIVYLAEHVSIGSQVVIKTLLPEHAEDKEALARFFNEAKAATEIKHPGIVKIFDFGRHGASAYIVMEYLEGESLSARLAGGRLAWASAVTIARQTASALGAAHRAGIIHRDLKPDNLVLVADPDMPSYERVRVLDFGIAKLARTSSSLTQVSSVMGTPGYMAPEQCQSAASVDARADVYALGCILYEMLVGRPPFEGTIAQLVTSHLFETPVAPRHLVGDIPPALEQTVLRALAKAPSDRHPDMASLSNELDGIVGRVVVTSLGVPIATPALGTDIPPASDPAARSATTVTTLSGSAHVTRTTSPPRRKLAVAGVIVMAIAGIASFSILRAPISRPEPRAAPPSVDASNTTDTASVPAVTAEVRADAQRPVPRPDAPSDAASGSGSEPVRIGTLAITSTPSAKIAIDGKDTGLQTPQAALELAAGTHRITLTDSNARRQTFRVTIRADRIESVHKEFSSPAPDRTTVNPFAPTTIDPFKREPRR